LRSGFVVSRIFLSHSSKDNFAAVAIGDWLRVEGWDDLFLDVDPQEGIRPGERWERALYAGVGLRSGALVWIETNRAHASMLLGRTDEAQTLYLAHRGEITQENKSWETVIREDFAELRKAGLTHPLMGEIEAAFRGAH
jgi:hypothetical protein